MQATLLQVIQSVCKRLAQPVPATVIGSTDKQVTQMLELLQEGQDEVSRRGQWQELRVEYTWTTTAAENQGGVLTGLGSPVVAPAGLSYILPSTLWDRTNRLPLVGQLDPQDWQMLKAWVINGPRYRFMLRQNSFFVNPAPSAGWTWAFEYMSEFFAQATGSGATKKLLTADTDVLLLPDHIVKRDLRWRWKREKGLSYEEDFLATEKLITDALARNTPGKTLHMDDQPSDAVPGIFVPLGSWNLP